MISNANYTTLMTIFELCRISDISTLVINYDHRADKVTYFDHSAQPVKFDIDLVEGSYVGTDLFPAKHQEHSITIIQCLNNLVDTGWLGAISDQRHEIHIDLDRSELQIVEWTDTGLFGEVKSTLRFLSHG